MYRVLGPHSVTVYMPGSEINRVLRVQTHLNVHKEPVIKKKKYSEKMPPVIRSPVHILLIYVSYSPDVNVLLPPVDQYR